MNTAMQVHDFTIEDEDFLFVLESKHKADFSMEFHRHNFFELAVVTGGEGYSQRLVDGTVVDEPIRRGSIILRDGNLPHRALDNRDMPLEQIIVIFDHSYLRRMRDFAIVTESLSAENPIIIHNNLLSQKLKQFVREILIETRARETGRNSLVFAAFSTILVHLMRDRMQTHCYTEALRDKRIRKAVDFISRHYYFPICLNDIASRCSLSKRHFCELFKRDTGLSLTQYIHAVRIEKAKEFLIHSDHSVTDIAFEIGYEDVSYFIKRFKMIEKMTPNELRCRLNS